jgi:hypothetical protein
LSYFRTHKLILQENPPESLLLKILAEAEYFEAVSLKAEIMEMQEDLQERETQGYSYRSVYSSSVAAFLGRGWEIVSKCDTARILICGETHQETKRIEDLHGDRELEFCAECNKLIWKDGEFIDHFKIDHDAMFVLRCKTKTSGKSNRKKRKLEAITPTEADT